MKMNTPDRRSGNEGSNQDNKASQQNIAKDPFIELTIQQMRLRVENATAEEQLQGLFAVASLSLLNNE